MLLNAKMQGVREKHLSDDALEPVLVPAWFQRLHARENIRDLLPLDRLLLGDPVASTNPSLASPPLRNTLTLPCHADVEVHAVDTNTRVVLDTKIDVFAYTEAEVASLREVALPQLIFLDLQATLEDFLRLGAADGDVDGNLFVTSDTECSHGVAGFAVDGGLTGELFEHLGCTEEDILDQQQRGHRQRLLHTV